MDFENEEWTTGQEALDDTIALGKNLGIDPDDAWDVCQYYLDEGYPPWMANILAENDLGHMKTEGDGHDARQASGVSAHG